MVHRCGRVSDDYVDEKGISTLDILDVGADTAGITITVINVTDYVLHAEVGLLDAGVKFLDELVEPIPDGIVTNVPDPLVEAAAESVEGVLGGVEGLVAGAHPD